MLIDYFNLLILAPTVILNYSLDVNRLLQFEEIVGSHESVFKLFSTLTSSHAELEQVTKTEVVGIVFIFLTALISLDSNNRLERNNQISAGVSVF
jgi:hypothetical protein